MGVGVGAGAEGGVEAGVGAEEGAVCGVGIEAGAQEASSKDNTITAPSRIRSFCSLIITFAYRLPFHFVLAAKSIF